jgi:hypothetical protein
MGDTINGLQSGIKVAERRGGRRNQEEKVLAKW